MTCFNGDSFVGFVMWARFVRRQRWASPGLPHSSVLTHTIIKKTRLKRPQVSSESHPRHNDNRKLRYWDWAAFINWNYACFPLSLLMVQRKRGNKLILNSTHKSHMFRGTERPFLEKEYLIMSLQRFSSNYNKNKIVLMVTTDLKDMQSLAPLVLKGHHKVV